MTSPITVTFVGAKGGVGTSTMAALHATQLARLGRTVRLTANDGVGGGEANGLAAAGLL